MVRRFSLFDVVIAMLHMSKRLQSFNFRLIKNVIHKRLAVDTLDLNY